MCVCGGGERYIYTWNVFAYDKSKGHTILSFSPFLLALAKLFCKGPILNVNFFLKLTHTNQKC